MLQKQAKNGMKRRLVALSLERKFAQTMARLQIVMAESAVSSNRKSLRKREMMKREKFEAQTRGITYSNSFKNNPRDPKCG